MHSSALLAHPRLPVDLPALGRYFTCHAALTLVAQHDRPIINYYGFPKTYYCDDFEEQDDFILRDLHVFPLHHGQRAWPGFGAVAQRHDGDFRRLRMILVCLDRGRGGQTASSRGRRTAIRFFTTSCPSARLMPWSPRNASPPRSSSPAAPGAGACPGG